MENSGSKMKLNGDLISKITLFCASISRFETIFLTKMSFSIAPWDATAFRPTRSPFSNLLISVFSKFELVMIIKMEVKTVLLF